MKFTAALVLATATVASAHTIIVETYVAGKSQGLYNGLRLPSYDGPITDVSSSFMSCNGGPNPIVKVSPNKIPVAAGSQMSVRFAHTLESDGSDVVDASHNGPIQFYLARVTDSVTAPAPTSGWFKIYSDGLTNGQWAVQKLIANKGIVSFTIPTCIAPGDYILRGELLALHAASSPGGAQFYQECAQLTITGGSGAKTPATVSLPGAYKSSDVGITYNLYSGQTSYTAPGPAVFKC